MNMPVLLSQTHYLLWAQTYMLNFGNTKWLFAQSSFPSNLSWKKKEIAQIQQNGKRNPICDLQESCKSH